MKLDKVGLSNLLPNRQDWDGMSLAQILTREIQP